MKDKQHITVMRRIVKEKVWKPITMAEAIHDLESDGYWKKGSTEELLKIHLMLWTPFAQFCIPKEGETLQGPGDNLEEELRLEIKRHLDKCEAQAIPRICARITTKEGYRDVEDSIIRLMLHDDLTAGAAIAQLENEYE